MARGSRLGVAIFLAMLVVGVYELFMRSNSNLEHISLEGNSEIDGLERELKVHHALGIRHTESDDHHHHVSNHHGSKGSVPTAPHHQQKDQKHSHKHLPHGHASHGPG